MKVTYQRAYSIGPFLQEKIGFEIEVEDSKNPTSQGTIDIALTSVSALKQLCDKAHEEINPHLSDTQEKETTNDKPPIDQTEQRIQILIQDINACTSIDEINGRNVQTGLISFLPLCSHDERIREAYDKRLKELQ